MRTGRISVIAIICSILWLSGISYAAPNKVLLDSHFKPGTAELKSESDMVLKEVLAMLDADPDVGLRIQSFPDNQGLAEDAGKLLQQRAQAVRSWLIEHGVNPNRLEPDGFGDSKPATAGGSTEMQGPSNRIELVKFTLEMPKAFLPVTKWEFEPVIDGQEVVHDFAIQNMGNAPLNIQKVKTG